MKFWVCTIHIVLSAFIPRLKNAVSTDNKEGVAAKAIRTTNGGAYRGVLTQFRGDILDPNQRTEIGVIDIEVNLRPEIIIRIAAVFHTRILNIRRPVNCLAVVMPDGRHRQSLVDTLDVLHHHVLDAHDLAAPSLPILSHRDFRQGIAAGEAQPLVTQVEAIVPEVLEATFRYITERRISIVNVGRQGVDHHVSKGNVQRVRPLIVERYR